MSWLAALLGLLGLLGLLAGRFARWWHSRGMRAGRAR
jgi:hypothetical protein